MTIADISVEKVTRCAEECHFSGVVSLSPLSQGASLELAFGFADRGHQVPNNIETRFAMASGSKVFTSVAIGFLIQEGKIELGMRLSDCLPSRKLHFASEITIEQLLTHTSGVPDYFDEEMGDDFAQLWRERPCYSMTSVRDFLPLFETKPMKASPGGFLYGNSGYILLGMVIEEMGCDFRNFIQERIFRPCDMRKTGYFPMNALPDNTAVGYLSEGQDERGTNIYSLPSIGGPDGGAYTTVGDLRLFWTSLLAGRFLSKEMVDRFVAPSVRVSDHDVSHYYGYGVWLLKRQGSWIISVVGSDPGVSMVSRVWLDDGLITTLLSNVQDGAWGLSRLLDERIHRS